MAAVVIVSDDLAVLGERTRADLDAAVRPWRGLADRLRPGFYAEVARLRVEHGDELAAVVATPMPTVPAPGAVFAADPAADDQPPPALDVVLATSAPRGPTTAPSRSVIGGTVRLRTLALGSVLAA